MKHILVVVMMLSLCTLSSSMESRGSDNGITGGAGEYRSDTEENLAHTVETLKGLPAEEYESELKQRGASSIALWRSAAGEGNTHGQVLLGACYYFGVEVEKDYAEAVKWYRKAAEQGEAGAETWLGGCYYEGTGVRQDYTEAVKWYRKAAEQGYAYAQAELARAYRTGRGVPQDHDKAREWERRAAAQRQQ